MPSSPANEAKVADINSSAPTYTEDSNKEGYSSQHTYSRPLANKFFKKEFVVINNITKKKIFLDSHDFRRLKEGDFLYKMERLGFITEPNNYKNVKIRKTIKNKLKKEYVEEKKIFEDKINKYKEQEKLQEKLYEVFEKDFIKNNILYELPEGGKQEDFICFAYNDIPKRKFIFMRDNTKKSQRSKKKLYFRKIAIINDKYDTTLLREDFLYRISKKIENIFDDKNNSINKYEFILKVKPTYNLDDNGNIIISNMEKLLKSYN